MSNQVNFYADGVDFDAFLQYAETAGFLAVPLILPRRVEVATTTAPTKVTTDVHQFYLLPPGRSRVEAFYKDLDAARSVLMSHASPVIEVSRGIRKGKRLSRSRIYFDLQRDDPRYAIALKGYNRLARFFSKWEREGIERIGPHAAIGSAAGRFRLVHFA